MNPVGKALWYIESHSSSDPSLDEIADVAGVSRFHLSHSFAVTMGSSIQRYLRGRRLTKAARMLADGAPDILAVAIESGYGSHEAFTRAFRDQFGSTPEIVREQRTVSNLKLVEAIRMDETPNAILSKPRLEQGRLLLIAGFSMRCNAAGSAEIPAQWQRFGPHIGHIPGQVGKTTYGVCYNGDDDSTIDYMSGVEVADFSRLPPEFARVRIAPQSYIVFTHTEHISRIRNTWHSIFRKGLPESGYEAIDAPEFERYGESFDPMTGNGGLEIWIPVKAK